MPLPTLAELPSPPPGRTGWPWTQAGLPLPATQPDGSAWPTISIVTPSYNQGAFLEATLRSVLLQGYPNLEYSVMDGGSTDESVEIIRRYAPWLTHWVSEKDRGQCHAINKGFALAHGEVLGWLNSDDLLLPHALRWVAETRRNHAQAAAWVGGCYYLDVAERVMRTAKPRGLDRAQLADWSYGGFFCQPACFFAAWAYRQAGPLDEAWHLALDLDLWLRLSAQGDFVPIPQVLSAARVHPEAKTSARRAEMHAETIAVQLRYGFRREATRRLRLREMFLAELKRHVARWLVPVRGQPLQALLDRDQGVRAGMAD